MFLFRFDCKAAFSAMMTIKSKKQNLLTDEHMEILSRQQLLYKSRIKIFGNKIQGITLRKPCLDNKILLIFFHFMIITQYIF